MRFWTISLASLAAVSCSVIVDDSPLPCTPHRLCGPNNAGLCVEAADGDPVCQPLTDPSVRCDKTYPDNLASLLDNDVLVVGLVVQLPTDVLPGNTYGDPIAKAVSIAIDGINVRGGLPVPNRPARRLLAVQCNESPANDSELNSGQERPYLRARVNHLAGKLRVPAIIGASTSGVSGPINTIYLSDSDALLLSPSATDDKLTDVQRDNQQLFWRTVPPDSRQAPALRAAHDLVLKSIQKSGDARKYEIASVYDRDNSAATNLQIEVSGGDERYFAISPTYDDASKASQDEAVRAILERKPAFIMPFGTTTFVTSMLADVERGWDDATPRPWYIMSEGNRTDFSNALAERRDLPARVIGTAPGARASSQYTSFLFDYREQEGAQSIPGNLAECGYDAAYLLAYAATKASMDRRWPSGPDLVGAIKQLSCPMMEGAESPLGLRASKADFAGDVRRIAENPSGCFDFQGASGRVDYDATDPKRQELSAASSDMALWCLGQPSNNEDQTANLEQYYYNQMDSEVDSKDPSLAALSVTDAGWCAGAVR